jgi:hypothetical protein
MKVNQHSEGLLYTVGEYVWCMNNNHASKQLIFGIIIKKTTIKYILGSVSDLFQEDVYKTKEDLLNSL